MGKCFKKMFYGLKSTVASLGGFVTNFLQFVRDFLCLVLNVPDFLLLAAAIILGVVAAISFFGSAGSVIERILAAALMCFIILLIYKIVSLAWGIICNIIEKVLDALDFSRITAYFTNLLQKSILQYMNQLGEDAPRKIDRIILFGAPFVLHKINWFLRQVGKAVCVLVYPALICAFVLPVMIGSDSLEIESWEILDWLISAGLLIALIGLAVYVGICFSQAIQTAGYLNSELDDLYSVYAELFRNIGDATNDNSTYQCKDAEEPRDNNPYFEVLATATTMDELKRLYREHTKVIHPDVCQDMDREEATRRQAMLNEAYAVLRKKYA